MIRNFVYSFSLCLLRVARCIHITFTLRSVRCAHISWSIPALIRSTATANWLSYNNYYKTCPLRLRTHIPVSMCVLCFNEMPRIWPNYLVVPGLNVMFCFYFVPNFPRAQRAALPFKNPFYHFVVSRLGALLFLITSRLEVCTAYA